MPRIDIDKLCEPIEVTVGGIDYTIDDIPRDLAKKMENLGKEAEEKGSGDTEPIVDIMVEILGAKPEDIAKLGLRKLLRLTKEVMNVVNEELEAKNVPEVAAKK